MDLNQRRRGNTVSLLLQLDMMSGSEHMGSLSKSGNTTLNKVPLVRRKHSEYSWHNHRHANDKLVWSDNIFHVDIVRGLSDILWIRCSAEYAMEGA